MSNLLTGIAISAVAPFVFQTAPANAISLTDPLQFKPYAQTVVVKKDKPAPKKEVEVKQETVVPETPKVVTYVVQDGDSLSVIADKYQTSWTRLWQKNTELENQDQLKVGDTITIPAIDETLAERALGGSVSVPSVEVASSTGQAPVASYRGSGGPNGYTYGWCTWWVKEKRPDIGGYWGDAGYSWISTASANGYNTGASPAPGAIGVTAGHVVYVESVNGSTVNISEMGYGYRANTVANYRTAPASSFTYIY